MAVPHDPADPQTFFSDHFFFKVYFKEHYLFQNNLLLKHGKNCWIDNGDKCPQGQLSRRAVVLVCKTGMQMSGRASILEGEWPAFVLPDVSFVYTPAKFSSFWNLHILMYKAWPKTSKVLENQRISNDIFAIFGLPMCIKSHDRRRKTDIFKGKIYL